MKIEYSTVKGSNEWNEDALILNDEMKIYGVADGATSVIPFRSNKGETGGRIASHIIKNTFEKVDSQNTPLKDTLIKSNTLLKQYMIDSQIDTTDKASLWTSGAAILKLTETHVEYVHTGDCLIIALYKDGSHRLLTRDHVAPFDEKIRQQIMRANQEPNNSEEKIKSVILSNKKYMNTLEGYPVLDGSEEAPNYFESGIINKINLTGIIISSDGLLMHQEENTTDNLDSIERLVKEVSLVGIEGYINYMNALEQKDQDCVRFPRFKISDDKTAISIEF